MGAFQSRGKSNYSLRLSHVVKRKKQYETWKSKNKYNGNKDKISRLMVKKMAVQEFNRYNPHPGKRKSLQEIERIKLYDQIRKIK